MLPNLKLYLQEIMALIKESNIHKLRSVVIQKDFDAAAIILDASQDSALHVAIRRKNVAVVELLLDHGFKIFLEHQNNDGKRPLHEASQLGSFALVALLLEKGAEVDPLKRGDWTPLMLACAKGHLAIIQRLIEAGASLSLVNKDGWTAFHIACRFGDPEVIQYLLAVKKDVWKTKSYNGRTPMHTAALHGNVDVVRLLLEDAHYPENEMDACGNTALMEAVRSGLLTCVDDFLAKNTLPLLVADSMGRLPIHLAAEAGKEDIVRALITNYGVNVNTLSKKGEIPLQFAAKEEQIQVIELLVSLGASVNHQDSMGRTALWSAASAQKRKSFDLLVKCGAEDIPDLQSTCPSSLIKKLHNVDG